MSDLNNIIMKKIEDHESEMKQLQDRVTNTTNEYAMMAEYMMTTPKNRQCLEKSTETHQTYTWHHYYNKLSLNGWIGGRGTQ